MTRVSPNRIHVFPHDARSTRAQRGNGYGVYFKGKKTTRATPCAHGRGARMSCRHVDYHGESPMAHGLTSGILVYYSGDYPLPGSSIAGSKDHRGAGVRLGS